ncbi:hypothetical protein Tco_1127670, partial [Tanacetum coccineum]
ESETCLGRTLHIRIRSWLPHIGDLRKLIMHGSHKSDYFIHPGSESIRFTGTTRNTPLEMGKYSHGLYYKPAKDNKLLLHDLGNHDHQKIYTVVRRKPLEFHVRGISVERSDTFWQTGKAEPALC